MSKVQNFSNHCLLRHTEAGGRSSKKSKKGGGEGSVALLKESIQLGPRHVDYSVIWKIVIKSHRQILQEHVAPSKFWEGKCPSQGVAQKCEPQDRNPWAPKFEERTQEETLQQERCARREAKDLANNVYMLKNKEKATFCFPNEAWVMLAPSSKKPEEREFVVDSGASMHMLPKKGLQPRRSGNPSKIQEPHDGSNWKTFAIMISS